jgi:polar amino acid transport system substrate-binding protein
VGPPNPAAEHIEESAAVDRSSLTLRSMSLGASLLVVLAGGAVAQSPSAPAASPMGSVAPAPSLTTPTTLLTPGILVDCVDIEYAPMEYFPSSDVTDPSQSIGFDVDAARAVAEKLGLTLQVSNTAFDALIPDLTAGRCDIVWTGLYVSEKRLAVADAVPYMATGQVVMVPKGNPAGITQPTDLCGKTVSIQGAGLVEQRINALSGECTAAGNAAINIQAYPKVADEFQQIVLGRADAVWETDTAVLNWMFQNPDQYEVAYALPRDDNYGVYYSKGNAELGDALAAAIKVLKDDGTLAGIATKYNIDPATLDTSSK